MKYSLFGVGTNTLTRIDGLLMLCILAWYFSRLLKKPAAPSESDSEADQSIKVFSTGKSIMLILAGLGCLIYGGSLFVGSAEKIAVFFGMSQKFIAITVMAAGTSLPELATCVVAALKGRSQLALGNVLGSNIFNILLILGGSSLIHPLSFGNMTAVDLSVVLASAVFLLTSIYTFKRNKLDKIEGILLLTIEAGYMTWLFMN